MKKYIERMLNFSQMFLRVFDIKKYINFQQIFKKLYSSEVILPHKYEKKHL